MEIRFETNYDQKAMTALAKGLRMTLRQKRSRRSHTLGWFMVVFGIVLTVTKNTFDLKSVATLTVTGIVSIVLIFEDAINAWIAVKRGIPGLRHAVTVFDDNGYRSQTNLGESLFYYDTIQALAETDAYFILMIGSSHGQVYDKSLMSGGSEEDFRHLLIEKTGKNIQKI